MTAPKQPVRRWWGYCLTAGGQFVSIEVIALTSHVGLRIGDWPLVWFDRELGDLLASDLLKAVTYAIGGAVT